MTRAVAPYFPRRSYQRYAMRIGQYAGRAIGKWYRNRQAYRRLGGGNSATSAKAKAVGSLSEQRDVTTLYRRRRAPVRVRRRARKMFKRFQYSMDKLNGMKTAVITVAAQQSWSPTNLFDGQKAVGITMYGYNTNTYASNTDRGNGDMWWIFAREMGGDPVSGLDTYKLRFRSVTMNYTIQNTYDESVYMDIYFVIARKNTGSTSDPSVEWSEAVASQTAGNMPNPIQDNQYYGLTPFDAPGFGMYWLVKSRKRVFMQPNEIYSFQQRDAGNYLLNAEDLLNMKLRGNLTEGVILVFTNPFVDSTVPTAPVPGGGQVQICCTKTYHYTFSTSAQNSVGQ